MMSTHTQRHASLCQAVQHRRASVRGINSKSRYLASRLSLLL